MGAAISLYSATCYALGRYGTGHAYPINLQAVVGLSGWLPGWKYYSSNPPVIQTLFSFNLMLPSLFVFFILTDRRLI